MNISIRNLPAFLVASGLGLALAANLSAQSTTFTYQGRLNDGATPANGLYDLRFILHGDAVLPGFEVGQPQTNSAVAVTNGLFTSVVDFGYGVFTGDPRWLELDVRTNGGGAFAPLTPRQKITATPYALHAGYAGDIEPGANVSFSGGAVSFHSSTPFYLGPFATNTVVNLSAQYLAGMDAGRFWWLGGNSGQLPGDYVLGTLDNNPLEFKVNGARALRLEPGITPNLIGGYSGNIVSNGFAGAVIGGGGQAGNPNRVGADFASVLGGYNNTAAGFASTAIGLGGAARGSYSTVIGVGNSSLGANSMTLGSASVAGGDYATAMGVRAHADHSGSFVWSDLTEPDFYSTAANQFNVRASGGMRLVTAGSGLTVDGALMLRANGNPTNGAFLGTTDNRPIEIKVNGQRALRIEYAELPAPAYLGYSPNIVGGSSFNLVSNGFSGAVIGGGGSEFFPNLVGNDHATVVGGHGNKATGVASTAMGEITTASGNASTAMGRETVANGSGATAMGWKTTASGTYSTAMGYRAKANHSGAFVWSDSTITDFVSSAANQFLIRASGGVGINTPTPGAMLQVGDVNTSGSQGMMRFASRSGTGAANRYWDIGVPQGGENLSGKFYSFVIDDPQLGADPEVVVRWDTGNVGIGVTNPVSRLHVNGTVTATAFNPPSDRNLKENFRAVDPQQVLAKVTALPISEWNFIGDAATPHVGPMAQDFHAAFGLGTDERHIATVDADGVALAAIQGLNEKVEVRNRNAEVSIRELKAENAELKQAVNELKALVEAMNQKLNGGAQ
jgi:hypothetical protein